MGTRLREKAEVGCAVTRTSRIAFTLIELLVVIAIISTLVTIMLPAIQWARESARRVTCQVHLKQLAMAAISHHDQHRHFPTGGWRDGDVRWTGDPERGFGPEQTGGWAYNILPFIEMMLCFAPTLCFHKQVKTLTMDTH